MNDLATKLIEYEQDKLSEEETIELFQELYDSGLAWNLQGHYGRQTYALLEAGMIEA